ncbi:MULTISPECIES: transporter substrate-binding domain-containing protein [unclassified Pseudomonas]|uniref:substrate-binding periplasmic protein n=1 Tax=unclassified Pseudomonas TaxID=196821 RepID=UPI0032C2405A
MDHLTSIQTNSATRLLMMLVGCTWILRAKTPPSREMINGRQHPQVTVFSADIRANEAHRSCSSISREEQTTTGNAAPMRSLSMTPRTFGKQARSVLYGAVVSCLSVFTAYAGPIRIVTEELPPYNMTQDGKMTGMSTEVVQAVLKEVNVQADIQSMPWARAYDLALHDPDVLIYSITRTAEREPLFKWVGTIAASRWYLYSSSSHPITLMDLDDARDWQTATVNEDVGEQYLMGNRFLIGRQLQSSNRYELNYQKLRTGHVDLWISDELNADYLARQAGDDPKETLVPSLRIPELEAAGGFSMAFSVGTSDATVQLFQQGLKAIRENGTYDAIARKWN